MDPDEPLLPAEQRLLDALRAQAPCNLIDSDCTPSAGDMTKWDDPERQIRACFLRRLFLRLHPDVKPDILRLRGGGIVGSLDLTGTTIDPSVALAYCRIDNASFDRATFTGDAQFDGSTFTGHAVLTDATFTGDAQFGGVTFVRDAAFYAATFTGFAGFRETTFGGAAWFPGATFLGQNVFENAMFESGAAFGGAVFTELANFRKATFTEGAMFGGATFAGHARFQEATFTGYAAFDGAMFAKGVEFRNAEFAGYTGFRGVAFTKYAAFDGATFAGDVKFDRAWGESLRFRSTEFQRLDLGPILIGTVNLDGATFRERVRLRVLCSKMSLRDTQLQSGGHCRSMPRTSTPKELNS